METFFDYMNSIYQKGIDDPPTDVDIETWATHICGGCSQESLYERTGLISGAKWMRGILTQKTKSWKQTEQLTGQTGKK
jgi:hypothetical protein